MAKSTEAGGPKKGKIFATKVTKQEVPFSPGNVAKAFNLLKNASKTGINPVEVVKGLSAAERRAVAAKLEKVNPAPKTGKFPSKSEMPKDKTVITRNSSGKTVKVDSKGNISSRPSKSTQNIKIKATDGITGKTEIQRWPKSNKSK